MTVEGFICGPYINFVDLKSIPFFLETETPVTEGSKGNSSLNDSTFSGVRRDISTTF